MLHVIHSNIEGILELTMIVVSDQSSKKIDRDQNAQSSDLYVRLIYARIYLVLATLGRRCPWLILRDLSLGARGVRSPKRSMRSTLQWCAFSRNIQNLPLFRRLNTARTCKPLCQSLDPLALRLQRVLSGFHILLCGAYC